MSTRRAATQPSPAPPTPAALREAALRHLARSPATAARLARVLDRRVERWQRAAEAAIQAGGAPVGEGPAQRGPDRDGVRAAAGAARGHVAAVVATLVAQRVLDDDAYAQTRARGLLRAGKSRSRVAQHLAERGIAAATIRDTLEATGADDLPAALLLARRRRIGPFGPPPPDDRTEAAAARRRALGILARAGFGGGVARAALDCDADAAAGHLERLRSM